MLHRQLAQPEDAGAAATRGVGAELLEGGPVGQLVLVALSLGEGRPRGARLPVRLHRLPGAVRRPARAAPAAGLPLDTLPAELAARAAAGEPAARGALDTAAWALGVALPGVLNVLDLPAVVLGGNLGELAGLLRPALDEHLARRVLSARWRRPVLDGAGTTPAAGATGAALAALDAVLADPGRWLR